MSAANVEASVLMSFKGVEPPPSREQILERVRLFGSAFQLDEETIQNITKRIQENVVQSMDEGVSLINTEEEHDEDWYRKVDIDWKYWKDYEMHLSYGGWGPKVVHTMGEVTDKILGLLKDPDAPGDWDRRGLVIGHVQSGKTANYIGLISKAADAGYRFIIVIAGIHNNLRKQTQQRIDEGFVGRNGETKQRVGVGELNRNRAFPVPLTNTASDFSKSYASGNTADLEAYDRPVILVIKKNVTTLGNVYSWLKQLNASQSDQISKIPMLLIDDEADNASINTNKPDLDPTRTNAEIRKLLKLFKKSCYVGYTATPFANIFINPDTDDEMTGDDLFPRDFIYCLDAPTNYFGAQRVFIDEETSEKVVREIDDAEDYIPLKHDKYFEITSLPPSAKDAIKAFIVAKAIRCSRNQDSKHCSMLINVSRFVDTQRQIKEHVSFYLSEIKDAVRYNYKKPSEEALKNSVIAELKHVFDREFSGGQETWSQIMPHLNQACDVMRPFMVNSKSDEALDYGKYDEAGEALTAVAIGGLSLSRGLTLEGLTVSYMYRNTKMYDTLMQMGRWFGYRPGYDDLCRVYLSDDSKGWYAHIAEATEELRQQVKLMRRDQFSPKQFGLYVRAHPDTLIVTAMNKMRNAQREKFKISFDNQLKESHVLPKDETISKENLSAMIRLYNSLTAEYGAAEIEEHFSKGSAYWRSISADRVIDFVSEFRFHREIHWMKEGFLNYSKVVSDRFPVWDVAFISLSKPSRDVDGLPFQIQKRSIGRDKASREAKVPSEEPGWYVGNKQKVSDPGVEGVGLTDSEREQLAKLSGDKKPSGSHFRDLSVRGRPLLMLHMLDLYDQDPRKTEAKCLAKDIPAMGFSFPATNEIRSVDCWVNKVWVQNDQYDSPDEEDDDE